MDTQENERIYTAQMQRCSLEFHLESQIQLHFSSLEYILGDKEHTHFNMSTFSRLKYRQVRLLSLLRSILATGNMHLCFIRHKYS